MNDSTIKDNWQVISAFFPNGWEEKAASLGALIRKRNIDSPQTLMRVLLIHLADGKSLRTTAAYAKEADLCCLNDTALLKRLRASSEWLRWIAHELLNSFQRYKSTQSLSKFTKVCLIDGSNISEPGSTGSDWRIHYSINLATLGCDSFKVTDIKTGEHLKRFQIAPGSLLVGDRGYCNRQGISYVLDNGGEVLIRLNQVSLPLKTYRRNPFPLLKNLRKLKEGAIGDFNVYFIAPDGQLVKGRLCAIRKSQEAIEKAIKALKKRASRKGNTLKDETLEYAEYVLLFTSVTRHKLKGEDVLSVYRLRWQVELAFKRLKSILGLGHLPKFDPESCKAWLHGKLVVAFLVEAIHREAEFFSPWGYPLRGGDGR